MVTLENVNALIWHRFWNRDPYSVSYKQRITQIYDQFLPGCCKKKCAYFKKGSETARILRLHKHGMSRYNKEMDITALFKTGRKTKMVYRNLLSGE